MYNNKVAIAMIQCINVKDVAIIIIFIIGKISYLIITLVTLTVFCPHFVAIVKINVGKCYTM